MCKYCGCAVSHQSVRGQHRCRGCYNQFRKDPINSTSNSSKSANTKERRLVDRPNCGSFYYDDKDGNGHWAYEEIGHGLTVAATWASLRKCWKGYRIASGCGDDDGKILYAGRIVFLCRLLKKEPPRFQELEEQQEEGGKSDVEYVEERGDNHQYYYYTGGCVDGNCCD